MQEAGKDVVAGDIYILEDDVIIGLVGGLKFQRIPRRVLDTLLPPDNGRVAPRAAPSPAPIASALSAARRPAPTPAAKGVSVAKAAPKSVAAAPKPKAAAKSLGSSLVVRAMNLVSSESEIDLAELQDETVFADAGIDSLLSLTIAGKFREDLGLDVPGDLFLKYPTVKALKAHIAASDTGASEPVEEEEKGEPTSIPSQASVSSPSEGTSTPWTLMSSAGSETDEPELAAAGDDDDLVSLIKATISEQMGLPVEEITGPIDLASLGMDSLMTISILGSLREQTGQNLSSSFFQDHPTMDDIEAFLKKSKAPRPAPKASSSSNASYPKAQSILLQGNPKTAEKTLFLIPDGYVLFCPLF